MLSGRDEGSVRPHERIIWKMEERGERIEERGSKIEHHHDGVLLSSILYSLSAILYPPTG
jgi:hypothetical protein